MRTVLVLFDGITSLDGVVPYEVLSRLPGAEVIFVGPARGEVRDAVLARIRAREPQRGGA